MSNRQDDALPELPEPAQRNGYAAMTWGTYTAAQMRDYAQSAIASLQAQLEQAREVQAFLTGATREAQEFAAEAQDKAASLQARLDAAEKDAARWRWFAGDCDGNGQDDLIQYLTRFVVSKAEIDAAVDAQMGSE